MVTADNTVMDFGAFCSRYYESALTSFSVHLSSLKKDGKHDEMLSGIDLEIMKHDVAVDSLDTVYNKYDENGGASVETFLSAVVRRKLLAALRKDEYRVGLGSRHVSLKEYNGSDSSGAYYRGGGGGRKRIVRREKDYRETQQDLQPFIKLMKRQILKLKDFDQIILDCFFRYGKGAYTGMVLKRMGLPDTPQNRHLVQTRFSRAVASLQKMMWKRREDFFNAVSSEQKRRDEDERNAAPRRTKAPSGTTRRSAVIRVDGIDYDTLAADMVNSLEF